MAMSRAEADLARLQADIGRLRTQLVEAEERATKIRHYIEMARLYDAGQDAAPPPVGPSPNAAVGVPRSGVASHIARAAREVLQERGGPMQTRPLVDALTKRGVVLGSNNPVSYLSGVLSRADDFENDRLTGWHLKASQVPPQYGAAPTPEPEPRQGNGSPEVAPDEPELSLRVAVE